jgi:hypothetical protein
VVYSLFGAVMCLCYGGSFCICDVIDSLGYNNNIKLAFNDANVYIRELQFIIYTSETGA